MVAVTISAPSLAHVDFVRAPVLATARPDGFKEWHHFVVHRPGWRLLVNFSLTSERRPGRASRLVPRVIVIVHQRRWTGAIVRFDPADLDVTADLGTLLIRGNRMSVGAPGYRVVVALPEHGLRGELRLAPASRPFMVNNQQIGDGRLSWLFVPRLRADGWFSVDGRLRRAGRRGRLPRPQLGPDPLGRRLRLGVGFGAAVDPGRPVVVRVHADDRPAPAAGAVPGPLRVARGGAGRDVPRRRAAGAPDRSARPGPGLHPAGADGAGARRGRDRHPRVPRHRGGPVRRPAPGRVPARSPRAAGPAQRAAPGPVRRCSPRPAGPPRSAGRSTAKRSTSSAPASWSCSMAEPGGHAAAAIAGAAGRRGPRELPASAGALGGLEVEVDVDGERFSLRSGPRSSVREGRPPPPQRSDPRPRAVAVLEVLDADPHAGRCGGGGPDTGARRARRRGAGARRRRRVRTRAVRAPSSPGLSDRAAQPGSGEAHGRPEPSPHAPASCLPGPTAAVLGRRASRADRRSRAGRARVRGHGLRAARRRAGRAR